MSSRTLAFALAAAISFSTVAHADGPPPPPKRTAGIVLTTVGGSILLTAAIVFVLAPFYVQANPTSHEAYGPIAVGAVGGGVVGLGLLIPGIVLLATSHAPKARTALAPETKLPAWAEARPVATGGPSSFVMPIIN